MPIIPVNERLIAYEARIKRGEKLSDAENEDYKTLKKQQDEYRLQQGLSGGEKPDLYKGLKVETGKPKKSGEHQTGSAVDIEEPSPKVKDFHQDMLDALDACPGKSGGDLVECTNDELKKQKLNQSPESKTLLRGLFGGDADVLKDIDKAEKAEAEKYAPKFGLQ